MQKNEIVRTKLNKDLIEKFIYIFLSVAYIYYQALNFKTLNLSNILSINFNILSIILFIEI